MFLCAPENKAKTPHSFCALLPPPPQKKNKKITCKYKTLIIFCFREKKRDEKKEDLSSGRAVLSTKVTATDVNKNENSTFCSHSLSQFLSIVAPPPSRSRRRVCSPHLPCDHHLSWGKKNS